MYDELALEASNAATLRLVSESWANHLQRMLRRLKSIGHAHRTDGAETLIKRFKLVRPATYYHSVRVCRLSRAIGRVIGFDESRLKKLSYTALLHDVGKILVPEAVLSRPRKPNRTELFIL